MKRFEIMFKNHEVVVNAEAVSFENGWMIFKVSGETVAEYSTDFAYGYRIL